MGVAVTMPSAEHACSCDEGCSSGGPRGLIEANRLARDIALERSHALLRQVDQVRELFTRIVLRGDSLETLRAAAAELLGRNVVIAEDEAEVTEPTVFPIEAAERVLGTVRVETGGAPLSDAETAIARQAAIAAAMLLLAAGSPRWPADRAASGSTGADAHSENPDDDWADAWLAGLPLESGHAYVAIAMTIADEGEGADDESTAVVAGHAIDRALQGRRIAAFLGNHAEEHVIVVPVAERARANAVARTFVEHVGSLIRLAGPRFLVNTGLTAMADDGAAVARRVREARMAARIGRLLNGPNAVTAFKDLRAFPAIVDAVGGRGDNVFADLHERYLGSLVRYEAKTGLPLVQTLSVLFDENGNVSGAARSLGINRQSLLYRLRKIETMCDVDLAEPADRFALELAVRSWIVRETIRPVARPKGATPSSAPARVTAARDAAGPTPIRRVGQTLRVAAG